MQIPNLIILEQFELFQLQGGPLLRPLHVPATRTSLPQPRGECLPQEVLLVLSDHREETIRSVHQGPG